MPTPEQRRARRLWVAENHPDRGGDPVAFAAGLAALGRETTGRPAIDRRLTVVRTSSPTRVVRRAWRRVVTARRRRTHHGSVN